MTPTEKIQQRLAEIKQKAQQTIAQKFPVKPKTAEVNLEEIHAKVKKVTEATPNVKRLVSTLLNVSDRLIVDFENKARKGLTALENQELILNDQLFLYPKNCRFFRCRGNHGTVVIEQPPQVRTVLTTGKTAEDRYLLPMPYVIFALTLAKDPRTGKFIKSDHFIGFKTTPLQSLEDTWCLPPLPNFSGNYVCMGSSFPDIHSENPTEVVESFVNYFWQSHFSEYFSEGFVIGKKKIDSFKQWEKLTLPDILKATFAEASHSVGFYAVRDQQIQIGEVASIVRESYSTAYENLTKQKVAEHVQEVAKEILLESLQS